MSFWLWPVLLVAAALFALALFDLLQKRHSLLRNFPLVAHLRYMLEAIGPELRQYIVTSNDEDLPFSRDQRRWIYSTAKGENPYFGFGSDNDIERTPNYLIIKQASFPLDLHDDSGPGSPPDFELPPAKVLGRSRGRNKAFRPESAINISGLSFGALSLRAIEAVNRGAAIVGCWQNTGEGAITSAHRFGGKLVFQIGTGYFGCRDSAGNFSLSRLVDEVAQHDVVAIEIKLSQGAKPGIGGLLPAAKVSKEVAAAREVEPHKDCLSPPRHSAFADADSMLDFVEEIADATGLPVGIKSAVGEMDFWRDLADLMTRGDRGVDFIAIDGAEGGTGAAPLVFSDHVSLPFKIGFPRVYKVFAERGLTDQITFIGSGRLGLPESALLAFAFGCDIVAVGREAMLALGCIQAQRCQTDRCPTGVTTNSKWLQRGLDPQHKAERLADYIRGLRKELLRLSRACGVEHPSLVSFDHIDFLDGHLNATSGWEFFGYQRGWGLPSAENAAEIRALMTSA
ncbi:MAG: FMN-binding glutamate synthase family protein [Acidobacteria bacterium]|nr:MAG: FMN-binding glutamate synthase family protein [Acidobacteriota bacterium]